MDVLMRTSGLAAPNSKHVVSRLYRQAGLDSLTQLRPSSSYPIRRELRAAIYASLDD